MPQKKKKATKRPSKQNYFVVVQSYSREALNWQDQQRDAEVVGPLTAEKTLEKVREKLNDGAQQSDITVIAGKRVNLKVSIG